MLRRARLALGSRWQPVPCRRAAAAVAAAALQRRHFGSGGPDMLTSVVRRIMLKVFNSGGVGRGGVVAVAVCGRVGVGVWVCGCVWVCVFVCVCVGGH